MNIVAAFIFLAGGGLFVLFSLGIFLSQRRLNKTRTSVKLVVVDSHAKPGRHGTSYIHLEYKIIDGPHSGLQKTSGSGTFPPLHALGDHVDGYFDAATDDIQSKKDAGLTNWFIFAFAGLGSIMLMLGVLAAGGWISL